jgi:hypothetical protein
MFYTNTMFHTKTLLLAVMLLMPNFNARHVENCNVFTIDNESSYGLGDVGVSGLGGTGDVEVPELGVFSDTLCFTPAAIVINGQTSTYPNTTTITLPSDSDVQVTWQSPQLVGISDKQLQDTKRQ